MSHVRPKMKSDYRFAPPERSFIRAGFNPMWNENFHFDVHVPDLALVRFVVEDHDTTSQNDLIGQYCLPVTSVQNGEELQQSRH